MKRLKKQEGYKKRGAIIGLVIGIIILIIYVLGGYMFSPITILPYIFGGFLLSKTQRIGGVYAVIFFYLIILPIIGAIIGWLVGKFKSRNISPEAQ